MSDENPVSVPGALAIPTLTFRRFRGPADYGPLIAVRAGSRDWDQVDPHSAREGIPTVEELAQFLAGVPPGTPDILIAEIDGQVVGYNHVLLRWTEETGLRVYLHLGYLLPQWRGRGIGQAMLDWAQARIRAIAAREHPEGAMTFATNVSSTEREAEALMRHNGYVAVRRLSDMVLEPVGDYPPSTLPAGVALRPIQPAHYRAIYQAWKEAFAGIWTSTPETEEDYQDFVAKEFEVPGFDPTLCQVAWAEDHVVGMVWPHIGHGVGVIRQVAVRKAWQRRGIARALMVYTLQAVRDRSITHVRLFTDAANGQGARSLYESLGFREVKQHIIYRKSFAGAPTSGSID